MREGERERESLRGSEGVRGRACVYISVSVVCVSVATFTNNSHTQTMECIK